MANVWFTSDLHWGHRKICRFREGFESEEEHRRVTKENILGCLGKRDVLWILGDSNFSMSDSNTIRDLQDLSRAVRGGSLRLVIGNHCGQHMDAPHYWKMLSVFDFVYGLHSKYGCWLSHAPIHPDELRGKFCVHGHVHRETITLNGKHGQREDPRYINMCLEEQNYMPRDLNWLRGEMEERQSLIRKYNI